jgi:hypothetical protein
VHRFGTLAFVAALVPATASAQLLGGGPAPILLPGSISISAGRLAPAEEDNVLGQMTVEQGFTIAKWGPLFVVGFADVGARHDSEGLAWNRATTTTAGLKIGLVTRLGVLQAAAGAMSHDVGRGRVHVNDAAYVTYWTGWRADGLAADTPLIPDALPGYIYASSGVMTPAEPENWISSVAMQQGAAIVRYRQTSLIPYVGGSAITDTAGFAWNNRSRVDAGIKLAREVASGVIEAGVAHRREWDRPSGASREAPIFYVNLWFGWNPRLGSR